MDYVVDFESSVEYNDVTFFGFIPNNIIGIASSRSPVIFEVDGSF